MAKTSEQEIFESAFMDSEEDIQAEVQRILRFPGGPDRAKELCDKAYAHIGSYGGRPVGSASSRYKGLLLEYDRLSLDKLTAFARHWIVNVEKAELTESNIGRVRKEIARQLKNRASGQ